MANHRTVQFKLNKDDLEKVHQAMSREGWYPEETSLNWWIKETLLDHVRGYDPTVKVMKSTDFPGSVIE